MAIEFKKNIDFKRIADDLQRQQEQKLGAVMEEMAERIVTRTRNQQAVDGSKFAKLSDKYAKHKASKGRKAVPDLTFSGRMLASITSQVQRVGNSLIGRIFFNSVKEAEKARGNQKLRKFFGLSRDQVKTILDRLR